MRPIARAAAVVLVALGLLWTAPAPASAHPLGNFTISRFSGIEVGRDEVTVHYVVDMAEIPTIQELGIKPGEVVDQAELDAYVDELGPRLLERLDLAIAGEPVELTQKRSAAELLPGEGPLGVLRIEVDWVGELASDRAELVYRDDNFANRLGWKEIVVYPSGGQGLAASTVPQASSSDELRTYPSDELSSPLNQTEARAELLPGATGSVSGARPETQDSDLFAGSFTSLIERDLTPAFLVVAMLLALGFGAIHALGPGHGKTVMAAYLLGANGRTRDALVVGVAVSAMHTLSVVALGLVTLWASALFPADAVYPWLSLLSGAVVLGLGTWMLRARLKARAARHAHHHHHDHAEHVHEHSHDRVLVGAGGPQRTERGHDHGFGYHTHFAGELPPGISVTSWRGLGAIALSGGLLPSPSALVVLLGSIALGRVAFGLTLVAAFSVGLAGALTLLGIAVMRTRSYIARRFGARANTLIPICSAATIAALGTYLTVSAVLKLAE
jgi:ABC-type nickel/cobalt efflux system permease component RcnA